jgi:hypothetical protein
MGVPLTQLDRRALASPAVYLLDEIADISRQSPEAATAIAEAVQKKLGSKNPVVKFKARTDVLQQQHGLYGNHVDAVNLLHLVCFLQALRIIKHLSTKGCSHFQRCMQRQSTTVRYAPWGCQQEQQADLGVNYVLVAAHAPAASAAVAGRDTQHAAHTILHTT